MALFVYNRKFKKKKEFTIEVYIKEMENYQIDSNFIILFFKL